jgi:hypothetical protein
VILDLRGKWRFQDKSVVRESEPPQYWYWLRQAEYTLASSRVDADSGFHACP